MEHAVSLAVISDDDLLRRLGELVGQARRVESDLVANIGEMDERRLYAREASPSMFAYCTEVLHLSEAEAYLRITAARAARKHPMLLNLLRGGQLHLGGIALIAPHLTKDNAEALLERASHRSKRQIEELIAEIAPRPDVPSVMRRLPDRRALPSPMLELCPDGATRPVGELRPDRALSPHPADRPAAVALPAAAAGPVATPARMAAVQAWAPGRYKVQFTATATLHDKLERLQALMRSQVPDGDLAAIIEEAVSEKLERLEARRFATTTAPRKGLRETDTTPSSRHIPAAVRRAVRKRDGDRCRYVDAQGRRCSEGHRLEYHHRYPFGFGGDHSLRNIGLVCAAHNAYLAKHDYGWVGRKGYRRPRIEADGALSVRSRSSTARGGDPRFSST